MADIPALEKLPPLPYLDANGNIPPGLEGKVGVYSIFDQSNELQYVGISRDISTSLKQHLVRVADQCHGVKVWTIENLDRAFLSAVQQDWLAGKVIDTAPWEKPIDCRGMMTDGEKELFRQAANEVEAGRVLKNVSRRIEQEILTKLQARGIGFEVRFNPKRKEEGLLDLKLW